MGPHTRARLVPLKALVADSRTIRSFNPFARIGLARSHHPCTREWGLAPQFHLGVKKHLNWVERLQKNLSFDADLTLQYIWDESTHHMWGGPSSIAEAPCS